MLQEWYMLLLPFFESKDILFYVYSQVSKIPYYALMLLKFCLLPSDF